MDNLIGSTGTSFDRYFVNVSLHILLFFLVGGAAFFRSASIIDTRSHIQSSTYILYFCRMSAAIANVRQENLCSDEKKFKYDLVMARVPGASYVRTEI